MVAAAATAAIVATTSAAMAATAVAATKLLSNHLRQSEVDFSGQPRFLYANQTYRYLTI